MTTYAPTVNPGDTRTRTRYFGARLPHDGQPEIEILEQEIIRTAAGERVLDNLGQVPVGAFDPNESYEIRNPLTDEPTGQTATVAQAYALIYSWVRSKQTARDNAAQDAQS